MHLLCLSKYPLRSAVPNTVEQIKSPSCFLPSKQWKVWLPHVPVSQSTGKSCRLFCLWGFFFLVGQKLHSRKCYLSEMSFSNSYHLSVTEGSKRWNKTSMRCLRGEQEHIFLIVLGKLPLPTLHPVSSRVVQTLPEPWSLSASMFPAALWKGAVHRIERKRLCMLRQAFHRTFTEHVGSSPTEGTPFPLCRCNPSHFSSSDYTFIALYPFSNPKSVLITKTTSLILSNLCHYQINLPNPK